MGGKGECVGGWVYQGAGVGVFHHYAVSAYLLPGIGAHHLLRRHKLSLASFNFNKTHVTLDRIIFLWPLPVGVGSTPQIYSEQVWSFPLTVGI